MERDTAVNQDQAELSFASKIDYLQPAGAYNTTLQFNIVANPLVDYMQNFTPDMCRTLASSDNYTVVDKRDDNDYTVRYINGNCWMTKNLRYIGDTVGSTSTTSTWYLKSATSNINADTTMSMTDLTSGNTYDAARYHNSGNTTTGVWYNYAAASAMTITGGSNTNPQTYDICPKGWRLPTNSEQSGITSYASAYSPVAGGYYYNGRLEDTGYGSWWSSTSYSSTAYRYSLFWNGSSLNTSFGDRRYGFYVRCILNDPRTISDITTMQEMNSQIVANTAESATATLKDSRDGQDYAVAKLNGNVWMTSNLLFTETVLDSTTSNIDSVYTEGNPYAISYGDLSAGHSYTQGLIATGQDNNGDPTVWYNYAAATAMTITGNSNNKNQVYDLCPANWKLPDKSTIDSLTSALGTNIERFNPVAGGTYYQGVKSSDNTGIYWTSTEYGDAVHRYDMRYNDGNPSLGPNYASYRYYGYYIRCIAK